MFTSRVKASFALVLTLLLLVLSACTGKNTPADTKQPDAPAAPKEVTLRFTVWTAAEAHLKLLNEIAAEYKQTHPNVTVKYQSIPFEEYVQKVTLQLAGGDPPDAGWIVENSAPTFLQAGVLVDLAPALKANTTFDYADFSQPAMQLWTRGDKVYGLPFSTSPFFVIYNKDLFAKAGAETPEQLMAKNAWTWENFAAAAKTVKEKTGIYGFETMDGQGYGARLLHTVVPIMRAYGGDAWNAEGTQCGFDSPESVAAVKLYHRMVYTDKSAPAPGEQADFYSGKAAMTIAQVSRFSKLAANPFKWDIAPMPGGPKGAPGIIGQAAVVAFGASKNKDVAADFVAFMMNKANVTKLAAFFPPARQSVLTSDALAKANPQVTPAALQKAVADSIKNGNVLPYHPEFPKIDLAVRGAFEKAWAPGADMQAAMTGVCKAVTPLLGTK